MNRSADMNGSFRHQEKGLMSPTPVHVQLIGINWASVSVDDEIAEAFADQELPVFVEVRSPHGGLLYISQAASSAGDSTLLPLVGGVASLPPGDVAMDQVLVKDRVLPRSDDQSHVSDLDLSNDSFMDL